MPANTDVYRTPCTDSPCSFRALWCAVCKDERLTSFPCQQRILTFCLFMGPYPEVIKVWGNHPIYFNGNWMRNMISVVQCFKTKTEQKLCSKVIIASRWVSLNVCEAAGGYALIWPNSAPLVSEHGKIWRNLEVINVKPTAAPEQSFFKWVTNKKARNSSVGGTSSTVHCRRCFYQ